MSSFDVISKGLLPFLGGMRRFIPFLFSSAQEAVPMSEWHKWSYHDMTCGSCAGSAAFGFYGMSVSANDLAMRSYIPAQVIFGRTTFNPPLLAMVLDGEAGVPDGKSIARDLVPDHIHPLAADVFDKLYYAGERYGFDEGTAAYFRYIAIRWVLLNKNYMYFLKLPTRDLTQLAVQGPQWAKTVEVIRKPLENLRRVAKDIDHLVHAIRSAKHERAPLVMRGDCRENIKNIQWDRPSFVGLNPPTAGNATFMQSNRVLDTLLFNEPQKAGEGDMPGELWRSLILDSVKHIPSGHYVFSFVGDGAVSWEEGCAEVFSHVGPIIKEWSFPWHGSDTRKAGLVMIRRA
ncbi:MAG: hypothetical protein KJZ83_00470 [Burkholderiaceae bacterium]|nr:hypothetical protein [Burkholderiaceae bacterium]